MALSTLLVPIATAIIGAAAGSVITGRREASKARREAAVRFRHAFAEAITQIDREDAHHLMHRSRVAHDSAIYEFRHILDRSYHESFDAAVETFQARRDSARPAALAVMESLGSGRPIDNSDVLELKDAITKLVSFADKI